MGFEPCGGAGAHEQRRRFLLWRVGARYFSDGVFSTVQRYVGRRSIRWWWSWFKQIPGMLISKKVVARLLMVAHGGPSRAYQRRVRAHEGSNDDDFSGFCWSSDNLSNGRGGYSMGHLEARVPRLTMLGGA